MNETSPASNAPPTHLVSDYIEIAYLAMVLIIGVPINLHVLFKLFRQKDKTATMSMRRGFVLLKINLNISDTLILCINNSGKLFWLTTYEWIAGETMCQVFKYLSVASLYLSSNIVVCIAIDRLWTVLHAEQFRREKHFISTRLILIIAWSLALVTSLPQLGAFRLFNVTQDSNEVWYQCTDIWSVYEYETEVLQKNKSTSFIYSDITKNIHELSHLFLVFFGPLIVMAIAYIIIAVKLTNYSKGQMQLHGNSSTCNGHADNQNLLHSNSVRSSKVPSKQSRSASDATTTILTQKPPIPGATTLDHGHPQLEAQSSLSRRSITESHKSSKSTMLTCTSFLKEEFSYCVCCNDEIDDERQARTKKISTKSVIYDDGASQSSIGNGGPLFTWTPVVPSRKNHSLPHMDNNGMSALIAKAAESDSLPPKRRSSVIARDFFYKITHKNNHNGSTSRRLSDLATPKQPAWRRQLRSRVFKTTLLVVVTHIIFWLPYNVISLLRFVSKDLHARMGQHMNIFEDMQFLIAIVNPFLYGFGQATAIMNTTVLAGPNILPEDYVEMLVLSIIIFFGIILNTGVFVQLMRQSKTPTASTSFLTGPYQVSSFTLFKVHLCITDFGIVLVHALIKLSWLYTGSWMLGGEAGCKIYQFLSAFTYYANSNVIVSIGLDRLKVVYTSHIQGAASVRRVRLMLAVSWAFAALCALPQLYVWEITMIPGYPQCTTIWMVHEYREQMTDFLKTTLVLYEMSHQFVVFWLPFVTLLGSYIFIVVRVVYYTLQPSGSSSGHHCGNRGRPRSLRKRLLGVLPNSSEQRLVSSTDSIHGEYYQFSYATTGDRTEMTRVTPSPSLRFGNGSIESRKGFWRLPFFRRHCDCLLGGETFAERVIEKRKTAVCFGSVRACCLNAEVSGPSFRPLGIQKKTPSSSPVWRRQLRSRIFITALAIVTTHFFLWLPYNLLNTARFVHEDAHLWMTSWGANLLEDLIVLNSVLNPILYAYEKKR